MSYDMYLRGDPQGGGGLDVKSEGKKTLGRPWRKWEENIKVGSFL